MVNWSNISGIDSPCEEIGLNNSLNSFERKVLSSGSLLSYLAQVPNVEPALLAAVLECLFSALKRGEFRQKSENISDIAGFLEVTYLQYCKNFPNDVSADEAIIKN
ncbi:hypothetical protein [Pantanalinema sp. GBBB05]|uniref:hypothetical protein n=1 Tax=Pantanalinema sp. GBBB05 TaxID=2604139 RepID=UPI001DE856DD|nr:hypothetical protein [Pantanalinema sp. GBBB05]